MAKSGKFKFFFRVWLGAADEAAVNITIFYPELDVVGTTMLSYEEWFLDISEQYNWETQRAKLQLDPTKRYQLVGQAEVTALPPLGPFDEYDESLIIESCKAIQVPDEYYDYLMSLE